VKVERRKYTRLTLQAPATLRLIQVEAFHAGILLNISEKGCFFSFEGVVPTGVACTVSLTVGEGLEHQNISLSGTIVRCDSEGIGIQFDRADYKQQTGLREIIDYCCGTFQY